MLYFVGPKGNALIYQHAAPLLQLWKAPMLSFGDLLGHFQSALQIAVFHRLLFLEGGIAVPDIIRGGRQRQVCKPVEPLVVDVFSIVTKFTCPSRS